MEKKEVVIVENVCKSFGKHKVLDNFSCRIYEQDFVFIRGASGCGKSTLLNIIGLLDTADSGDVCIHGEKIKAFSKKAEQMLRYEIGYLFQNFALMEDESVNANLKIALAYSDKTEKDIGAVLQSVGLEESICKKLVLECSGGEQQRIAMARLLLKPCTIILADEPTGSLDAENRDNIINLLKVLNESGKTIIVASHDMTFENVTDIVLRL